MIREVVHENKLNYLNGEFWADSDLYSEHYSEKNCVGVSKTSVIDYTTFLELELNDFFKNISLSDLLEILNYIYVKCKEINYGFSALLTSRIRVIEWKDNKKKKEYEEIIRLSVIKNNNCHVYVDLPIIGTKEEIQSKLYTTFCKLINENTLEIVSFPEKTMNVILSPKAAGYFIHEIIGHPLELDFVQNCQSIYTKNDIGSKVLPEFISISEKPQELSSLGVDFGEYDDTGKKLQNNVIIERGVLKKFVDYKRCDKVGNSCLPRMYNLCLENNHHGGEYSDIISKSQYAVAVDDIICGDFNYMTKRYSLSCGMCKLVENGKVVGSVEGMVIEDTIYSLKDKIIEIGSDSYCSLGKCSKSGQIVTVGMTAPTISLANVNII